MFSAALSKKVILFGLLYCGLTLSGSPVAESEIDFQTLSLSELLQLKVSTVSRKEENLDESPAFMELITADDLNRRGYKDLSYLLDDIAGIQVTRTFGDNYFNTFWRGVRHTIGSSYLLLVDGVEFNHLYNNETEIMATFPLSNIQQIEVVHGASTVAYGNDAVVGVINIITKKPGTNSGESSGNGFVQVGDNNNQVVDFNYATRWQNYQVNLAGRYDQGLLDFSNAANYRWTDPALLDNSDIWGGFTQGFSEPESPHYNSGMNFRLSDDNSQWVFQYYKLATGYGLGYTFDHSLPNAGLWYESELSAHWKQEYRLDDNLNLSTLFRYRRSNIDDDSFFIEGYLVNDGIEEPRQRLLDASYWESLNNSKLA